VLEGKTQTKIRLEGIDAPERHQAFGTKSRQAVAHKVFQKPVRVEWRELDKYGRTLGQIFVDDRWINKEMVQEGWAWHYRQYSKSEVLSDAESEARTAKVGLWADEHPIAPWEFRHPPTPIAAAPAPLDASKPAEPDPSQEKEETVYVTKTGAKYHRAGCRHLKSSIPMKLSEAAERYSPCSVCNPPSPKGKTSTQNLLSKPSTVDRNPNDESVTGHTSTGIPTFTGPRGGQYHYSKNGNKVYERRKR
jgi:hypothetical protein